MINTITKRLKTTKESNRGKENDLLKKTATIYLTTCEVLPPKMDNDLIMTAFGCHRKEP